MRRVRPLRAVVVGEAILDVYLEGRARRVCREAPVPVVVLARRTEAPGGAANTAANLRGLGADVLLVSAIGDDDAGAILLRDLRERGIRTDGVVVTRGRRTLVKSRILAGQHVVARYDEGSDDSVDKTVESRLIAALERVLASADLVVVSDYDSGILTPDVVETLQRRRRDRPLVVDARRPSRYERIAPTAVKASYGETTALLACDGCRVTSRVGHVIEHAEAVLAATAATLVAVTVDVEGAVLLRSSATPLHLPVRAAEPHRTVGAGDTFTAAFALALAQGRAAMEAFHVAMTAAAIAVRKDGTSTCSAAELRRFGGAVKHVPSVAALTALAETYRAAGRRIVFTNGCFDIVHPGHIRYLRGARGLGDVLIVGVNSDASVRRLKGAGRPINPIDDRLDVLTALESVDHVVVFGDDTADGLIEAVRPDVFVKGGDYGVDMLPEAERVAALGGRVTILPYIDDRSTSRIIDRVRSLPRLA